MYTLKGGRGKKAPNPLEKQQAQCWGDPPPKHCQQGSGMLAEPFIAGVEVGPQENNLIKIPFRQKTYI